VATLHPTATHHIRRPQTQAQRAFASNKEASDCRTPIKRSPPTRDNSGWWGFLFYEYKIINFDGT